MFKRATETSSVEKSDSSSDSEQNEEIGDQRKSSYAKGWKTALIGSRGMGSTCRRFLKDLSVLLPHSKRESKYEYKGRNFGGLVEVCELSNCTHSIFVQESKSATYMHVASISGPSVKYELRDICTLEDQIFDGNCSKYSRPLLLFSPHFWTTPEGETQRVVLSKAFGSPLNHRKVRPFFDRIFYFYHSDQGILFRNYEILSDFSAKEIGPRFMLYPLLTQEGPNMGRVLWKSERTPSSKSIVLLKRKAFGAKLRNRALRSSLLKEKMNLTNDSRPSYEDAIYS
jgi:ribosome biogenesis protein BRX1